ncbi:NAD(P)H-binding protein [Weissella uvarum]|nr:NAD(P)H-binding protein [Weissella uvarum]
MKITLLGSTGNINQYVIPQLVNDGHLVTVVSSNPNRVAQIEALGAKAAIGSMRDRDFLAQAFKQQDAVYLMISGSQGTDLATDMQEQATIFKDAITQAQVKNVVQLSSVGAQAGPEAGALHAYAVLEQILSELTDVNIAFVRPAGFYNNLYNQIDSVQKKHVVTGNLPEDTMQKFADPSDIAQVVIGLLENTPIGITGRYVVSDTFTMRDFVPALAEAAQIPDLKFEQLSDEQNRAGMAANHVPEAIANGLIQMAHFQMDPEHAYAPLKADNTVDGQVKMADFIQRFVKALHGELATHVSMLEKQ